MSGERGGGRTILGEQHARRGISIAQLVSIRAVRALGEMYARTQADVLSRWLPMRTTVSTAPSARLRSTQRMPWHILRLVSISVVLHLQMLRCPVRISRHVAQSAINGWILRRFRIDGEVATTPHWWGRRWSASRHLRPRNERMVSRCRQRWRRQWRNARIIWVFFFWFFECIDWTVLVPESQLTICIFFGGFGTKLAELNSHTHAIDKYSSNSAQCFQ